MTMAPAAALPAQIPAGTTAPAVDARNNFLRFKTVFQGLGGH
jgi:hypothetical protein